MLSLDPDFPLVQGGHYFYSRGKETGWIPTTAEELATVLQSRQVPLYRTVHALAAHFVEDKPMDTAYRGPMHVDIDVSEEMGGTSQAIIQVRRLCRNLEKLGVDPEACRWFASGGKGFHLEVPDSIVSAKPGFNHNLPAVYKEIVHRPELYVDGIDPRVYSARRGRMWRTPNVQRENGKYKVPISFEQVLGMTVEDYVRLTSEPQPWPRLSPPTYAPALALFFMEASDTVQARAKAKASTGKESSALKARFGGKVPPSVQGLLQNKIQSPVGWNLISIQLGALARGIGLSVDELVNQARPLLEGHIGDGSRYRTPQAREAELRNQYAQDSYPFSVGALKSILPRGINTRDLSGLGGL